MKSLYGSQLSGKILKAHTMHILKNEHLSNTNTCSKLHTIISRCFDLIRKKVSSSSGFNIPTMYEALQDKSDKAAACVLDCSSSNVD